MLIVENVVLSNHFVLSDELKLPEFPSCRPVVNSGNCTVSATRAQPDIHAIAEREQS